MSDSLKVKISLDARGYSEGIDDAKKSTEQYNNQVTNIKKNLPSLNKELAKAKKEAKDLALAVANLTEEQKRTAEGRNMIKMLQEAQKESARLLDISIDTNNAMKRLASDTFAFDVLKDSINGVGSTMTAFSGIIGIVTGDEDKMKKAMTGLATTMSVVNGLTSIQNLLQKESSVMLAISALQSKAKAAAIDLETAAQGKNIVATKGATAAQWALNAAADANPYVLILTAVAALAAGYIAYADEINKLIGIENNLSKTENELREELKNHSSELAKTTNNVYKLSDEWKGLKTEAEQKQWIKDNQAAFDDLGISINSVKDAENVFVKNTPKLLAALEARTMAAAYDALANKKLQEAIDKGKEADIDPTIFEKGLAQAKSTFAKITSGNFDRTIEGIGEAYSGILLNTILNDKKLTNHVLKERHDEILELTEQSKEYLKKSAESLEDYNNKLAEAGIKQADKNKKPKKSKKPDKITPEALKGSLADLEKTLSEFQDKYKKGLLPNISAEEYKSQVKKMQDTIKQTKIALGIEIEPEEGSINYFKGKISELESEIGNISMYIDVDGKVNPEFIDKLNEIKLLKEQALTPDEKLQKQYDKLQKQLKESQDKEAEYYRNKKAIQEKENKLLKEKADEQMRIYDAIGQSAQGVGSIMSSISQLAEDESFNTAGIIMEAVANIALSFAKAMKDHKSFTIWDWIAAGIAGTAQMFSMIAAIKSATSGYADGGIVGGNSFNGDKLLARVNSGEMILNNRQQSNLFNAIDENKLGGSTQSMVLQSVRVRGADLYLTMKNYENTTGKKL